MVDAKDPERFSESKAELDALLSMEELNKTPFLILGNKIDHPNAVSEDQLRHELGLYQTSKSSDRSDCLRNFNAAQNERLTFFLQSSWKRQSSARRHSANRDLHVLRGYASRLRRGHSLAIAVRLGEL